LNPLTLLLIKWGEIDKLRKTFILLLSPLRTFHPHWY